MPRPAAGNTDCGSGRLLSVVASSYQSWDLRQISEHLRASVSRRWMSTKRSLQQASLWSTCAGLTVRAPQRLAAGGHTQDGLEGDNCSWLDLQDSYQPRARCHLSHTQWSNSNRPQPRSIWAPPRVAQSLQTRGKQVVWNSSCNWNSNY